MSTPVPGPCQSILKRERCGRATGQSTSARTRRYVTFLVPLGVTRGARYSCGAKFTASTLLPSKSSIKAP